MKKFLVALCVLPFFCGIGHAADSAAPAKPNIVFILSDDHSLQTIGAYGARLSEFCKQQNVTPNLDRLAEQGGLFVNSFCGNSLCAPSRAAILTGLHAHANGVTTIVSQKPIPSTVWNYEKGLRAAGYQTALIGKWHLLAPPDTDFSLPLVGQGRYWNPIFIGADGKKEEHAGYVADVITDISLDWLKHRDQSKPFMLAIQHKSPHRPWMPPPRYYGWLQDVKIPEPPTLFDDYSGRASPAHNQKLQISKNMNLPEDLKVFPPGKWSGDFGPMSDEQRAEWSKFFAPRNEAFTKANLQGDDLTRWKYQEYMKDYLRCVKSVDDSVGRVLAELKAEGLESNTVVIYSSDQGFYNGEHGWFDKRWIYEESIHMPFIIRWPGVVKPGTRFNEFIQNIDYAETFVDIAGGKIPDGLHGHSLVPVLRGETPADWRKSVYYHFYEAATHNVPQHYGVRNDQYTLVYFYKTDEWELYDLKKDPQQLHSVYADPAYAKVVVEMKAELTRLRQQFKDSDELEKAADEKIGKSKGKSSKTKSGKPTDPDP